MEKSLQTVHFHSSDSRFCGSKKRGRQFTFDVNEVTCEKCADQIGLVLTEQGRQALRDLGYEN